MNQNLLVTLANENYIDQAKQLFSSAYFKGQWQGDFMLLAHKVPEKDLKWFKDKGILIKKVDLIPYSIGLKRNVRPALVFCKLHLFRTEFKKWKQIVFLDADIIVRKPLHKLTKSSGFTAPNACGLPLKEQFACIRNETYDKLTKGYTLRGKSFNTGVFSFNTSLIEEDTFNQLVELVKKYGSLNRYGEEPTINLLFYKNWKELNWRYNHYPHHVEYRHIIDPHKTEKAIILHFVSPVGIKSYNPWDKESKFYPEWKRNLELAEKMDLDNRPEINTSFKEKFKGWLRSY